MVWTATATATALAIVLPALVSPSAQERYLIDPQHLTVGFLVEHVGFAKVFGRFTEAEGSFDFDEATGTIANVRVVVKTASVDTTVEPRDRHLRSGDFLNVEEHPEMIFESKGTTLVDREGKLEGNLTVIGKTRPVTLEVTWNKSGTSPLPGNPYVVGMSVRGSFQRSAFGMTYGVADGLVGDEVELLIELEAQRQQAADEHASACASGASPAERNGGGRTCHAREFGRPPERERGCACAEEAQAH